MTDTLNTLIRYLPPFLDPNDSTVSVVLNGLDQELQQAWSDYQTALVNLGILGATGAALDTAAARFGIQRLPGEADSALLTRLSALMKPRTTPNGIAFQFGLVGQQIDVFEPGGGSLVGWNPTWAFNYDRTPVTATYTRASGATGPDGSNVGNNQPTWQVQTNSTSWASVFQGTTQLLNNTGFTSVTSGVPTNYTESLLTGDTMSVITDSAYPISTDSVVQFTHGTAASSGNTTFTSPTVAVAAGTTYALSVYTNTSGLTAGSLVLAVVDNHTTVTTVLATQGVTTGYTRVYGTYTPAAGATTIQLQIQFAYNTTGTANFASPQIEAASAPTEYFRNTATSGTAIRTAETLSYPSSVFPIWGQGTIAVALNITPATQIAACDLLDSNQIGIHWNGTAWQGIIVNGSGSTTLQVNGQLSVGTHYFILRWHAGLSTADFWIDGQKLATSTTVYAPDTTHSLFVGSSTAGSLQVNGYVGNVTILNAWLDDATISKWAALTRTPIFAPTLLQANYENKSLASTTGSTEFGTANFLMLTLQSQNALSANPFWLDVSYLDSAATLQAQGGAFNPSQPLLTDNVAGGVDPQPWVRGGLQ